MASIHSLPDPVPIPAVESKLNRAYQHLRNFNDLFDKHKRSNAYSVRKEINASGIAGPRTYLVPVPDDLVCAAGDTIHNLQCAVDHLAFAVAVRSKLRRNLLGSVYFPSRKTRKEFEDAIKEAVVSEVGPQWVKFLTEVEPYRGGKGENLYRIKQLDKIDKHRKLIATEPYLHVTTIRNGVSTARLIPLEKGIPGELPAAVHEPDAMVIFHPLIAFADSPAGESTEDAFVDLWDFSQAVHNTMLKALQEYLIPAERVRA